MNRRGFILAATAWTAALAIVETAESAEEEPP